MRIARIRWLALTVVFWLAFASAEAAQRTFVSAGSGNDSNPCTRQLPCRNFAAAIAQTDPGGEVVVLDSGGYGAVMISGSISIISPQGVYAGITGFSGSAVEIDAALSDTIVLRGLTLQGLGAGEGLTFLNGKVLVVESCVVTGFSSTGINISLTASGQVFISDTVVRNGGLDGIVVLTQNGIASATIDNVLVENNGPSSTGFGILAFNNSRVLVRNSVSSGNGRQFQAGSDGVPVVLDIESCAAMGNGAGAGIFTSAPMVTVRVSNTVITNNANGVVEAGSPILSRGNNTLEGNGAGNTFSTTFAPK